MKRTTVRLANGSPELTFEQDGAYSIMATMYNPYVIFPESRISIETTNQVHLLRGTPQHTFNLSRLSPDQKAVVFDSLPRRKIDIVNREYGWNEATLLIHAI